MWFLVIGGVLGTYYGAERITAWVRKSKIEKRRAQAEYPITGNDPGGRTVIF